MENRLAADPGPRHAQTAPDVATSPSRQAVLAALREHARPADLVTVAAATGLHVNTVREHLAALVQQGLVERRRGTPNGRGRPAWLYEASRRSEAPEYAALARVLASAIATRSGTPEDDALAAGDAWGRELAGARRSATGTERPTARRAVLDVLSDVGFAPQDGERPTDVLLTRCPLLDVARRVPDVVCTVHLGLVRGVLAEYGAGDQRAELYPFSEPGACLLRLYDRSGAAAS